LANDASNTPQGNGEAEDLIKVLEDGVKAVLKNRRAKSSERVAAIAAGVKLAMVKYKISGADEDNFFK
jgi:hypothetical protein